MLDLLKTNDKLSLSKILATTGYVTFILLSIYLALMGKTWGNYGEFALAAGGGIIVRVADKWINVKRETNKVGDNVADGR